MRMDMTGATGLKVILLALTATAAIHTRGAGTPTDEAPADRSAARHPFLYAGEWDPRKPYQSMFVVREGKVTWQYSVPLRTATGGIQEFDDATMLSNWNIIFSRMSGAG